MLLLAAHVDHGKTTLVDKLLVSGGGVAVADDRVMDSNEFEKERSVDELHGHCCLPRWVFGRDEPVQHNFSFLSPHT